VGKILQKTRMGKLIDSEVREGRLSYTVKDETKTLERSLSTAAPTRKARKGCGHSRGSSTG
jgi:hypothetical protein